MAYRGLTIIFASFLIFLGQCGYSNGECAEDECPSSDLGNSRYLQRNPEPEESCYNNGSLVDLSCEEPWTLLGPLENTCNNGTWENDMAATCDVYCSPPEDANLILNPNKTMYEVGDKVTFSCKAGYKLTSDPSMSAHCNDTGNLNSTQEPKCIAFNCSAPTHTDKNLNWTGKGEKETYNGDETITYSCSQGFTLEGSNTGTCIDQDEWESGEEGDPTCSSGNIVQVFWYFLLMTTFYSVFSFYM